MFSNSTQQISKIHAKCILSLLEIQTIGTKMLCSELYNYEQLEDIVKKYIPLGCIKEQLAKIYSSTIAEQICLQCYKTIDDATIVDISIVLNKIKIDL